MTETQDVTDGLGGWIDAWVDAEARGDAACLDALLDQDFQGDGPDGFVLTKDEWLDRYRSGGLTNHSFTWHDVVVRLRDDTAIVMGIQAQQATLRGRDCSGRYRGTLVAVRRGERWMIVNLQLNRLMANE